MIMYIIINILLEKHVTKLSTVVTLQFLQHHINLLLSDIGSLYYMPLKDIMKISVLIIENNTEKTNVIPI